MNIVAFQKKVIDFYTKQGRHDLPWRKKITPYRVLVSEVMLQQTQVDRVIPKFKAWIKEFPSVRALARAPQSDVLKLWSGLGYNRRALNLHRTAKEIMEKYAGKIPRNKGTLVALPGIGPYTAGAIRAFAWNVPDVFIETNIRRVFIHHFFGAKKDVHDNEIFPLVEKALQVGMSASRGEKKVSSPARRRDAPGPGPARAKLFSPLASLREFSPREFYSALMDYGTHLAKKIPNPNRQSKHYTKQSKFEGSIRQLRGEILRLVSNTSRTRDEIIAYTKRKKHDVENVLSQMVAEGFLEIARKKFRIKKDPKNIRVS